MKKRCPVHLFRLPMFPEALATALMLCTNTLPSLALAQPAPSTSSATPDQATLTARARFSEAVPLMKQARWKDAYPLLIEAWKHKQHWQIGLNLGRTELEIGKYRDAVEHLTFAESAPDGPLDSQNEATKLKEQAKAKLGYLRIDASPPGARVFVDGALVDKAPLAAPVAVDPGPHDVEIRFGGRKSAQRVEAKSGETATTSLVLRILDADPEATDAAPAPAPVSTGRDAKSGSSVSARTWIGVAGAGLTAAGIGVGIGTAVASFGKSSELEARGYTAENQPVEHDRVVLANISTWSFIGAGLVAGGTVAAILLWPKAGKQTMSIEARSAGTSLTLIGRW